MPISVPNGKNRERSTLHLLVDTGSPFTWVVSKDCKRKIGLEISPCRGVAIDPPAAPVGRKFHVKFGVGDMTGEPHQLSLQFPEGSDGQTAELLMHVLVAKEQQGAVFATLNNFDGIFGVARVGVNSKVDQKFSFVENYNSIRRHLHEVFSIDLSSSSGQLKFGLPIHPPSNEHFRRFPLLGDDFWILQTSEIRWGQNDKFIPGKPIKVVLDSGTTETAVSPELFAQLGNSAEFSLVLDSLDNKQHVIKVKAGCKFIQLDLANTDFAGAIVLGQSFFIGREIRFGPSWVDIFLNNDELA